MACGAWKWYNSDMSNMTPQVVELAQILWDYNCYSPPLVRSDFILVLGSQDERVAIHAAELYADGWAPLLVTSGALGKVTRDIWHEAQTEGDRFAAVAVRCGVPESAILVERTATNTGDNVTRTRDLLCERGIEVSSGILVAKPYMKRRAFATACKQWPELRWAVSSEEVGFAAYLHAQDLQETTINLLVGDLQRIRVYADRGFQAPQPMPEAVWRAYEALVALGFDRYVIRDA